MKEKKKKTPIKKKKKRKKKEIKYSTCSSKLKYLNIFYNQSLVTLTSSLSLHSISSLWALLQSKIPNHVCYYKGKSECFPYTKKCPKGIIGLSNALPAVSIQVCHINVSTTVDLFWDSVSSVCSPSTDKKHQSATLGSQSRLQKSKALIPQQGRQGPKLAMWSNCEIHFHILPCKARVSCRNQSQRM